MINNNLLHGITLSFILDILIEKYGFEELDKLIKINCFSNNPSKQSSLKFLRKTPWARNKVEQLYIDLINSGYTHTLRPLNQIQ